jgi:RecA-family ATPase
VKPRVLGGDFDFVLNPLENETDGCFPRGEVSLIAASSGGGKTTLMMTLLEDQKAGRPVFRRTTNSLSYLLVLEDRSEASLRRTFARMRLDIESTPYRLLDRGGKSLAQAVADILDTTDLTPAVVHRGP